VKARFAGFLSTSFAASIRDAVSVNVQAVFATWAVSFGLLLVGCGAPGEPVAPSPPVAASITDLAARQVGDGVQLTFTLPTRSPTGDRLTSVPAVEVLRGSPKADGSPDLKSLRVVDTVPGSLADKYALDDKFQFTDPLAPDEIKTHPGALTIYAVRTRLSPKRASANSNFVSLHIFAVPQRIAAVDTQVTEPAIELSWAPVDRSSAGEPLNASITYNIYRAELDAADAQLNAPLTTQSVAQDATQAAAREAAQIKLDSKLQLLVNQPEHTYSDKSFEFGKTYAYVIRSSISANGTALESSDSTPAILTPRDTFPPATPQAISAAVLPGETAGTLIVELSWSINVEPDFAGYRVYRSDQPDTKGNLLTPELLPTPAYRDSAVQAAHRYWYSVTAVDRTGNESGPSIAVAVDVQPPSQ
jgi:hypothetical protein